MIVATSTDVSVTIADSQRPDASSRARLTLATISERAPASVQVSARTTAHTTYQGDSAMRACSGLIRP